MSDDQATPRPTDLVRAFHQAAGLPVRGEPTVPPGEEVRHRGDLLAEEVGELVEAVAGGDLVQIARELADVVYVAYGTALTYGIPLDQVIAEVHRANMSKLAGGVRVADGKVTKPSAFVPPDVAKALGLA